ncbi:MAG: mycothiol system anti-sigma-R factor [Actinomycetes bacterium]|jgi:mycothiol system anti-sigma-R factor
MSRNCDEALANLYAYLDRELDEVSAEEIRAHLAECGGCDRPFDFERRLREVIRTKLDEDVPEEIIARIRAAIATEAQA